MSVALLVDEDRAAWAALSRVAQETGVGLLQAANLEEGLAAVRERTPDLILLDLEQVQRSGGLELYRQLRQLDPRLPVILVSRQLDSATVIEMMKLDAFDYLQKPLDGGRLQQVIQQALDLRAVMRVPAGLTISAPEAGGDHTLLLGRSPAMVKVFKAVGRVASQDVTVLIHGESGTGKELVARAIFQHSPRSHDKFLAVNCAALPDSLLESELFGHEKGSFTGAESRRVGKFEQCSGGTIFLDEIGDMSPLVQSKILRLLQEQRFERVGGNQTISVDVRVIAATNRNLEKMVEQGDFRSDLYYRLNGFTIELPPLRDRGDDILLLLEHFLARASREMGKQDLEGVSPEAVQLLMEYRWPGNVRELQSVVKQVVLNATGPLVIPRFLPEEVRTGRPPDPTGGGLRNGSVDSDLRNFIEQRINPKATNLYAESLEMLERCVLTDVLRFSAGNQSKAAAILGITRGSLRNKVRTLGISIDHVVSIDRDS